MTNCFGVFNYLSLSMSEPRDYDRNWSLSSKKFLHTHAKNKALWVLILSSRSSTQWQFAEWKWVFQDLINDRRSGEQRHYLCAREHLASQRDSIQHGQNATMRNFYMPYMRQEMVSEAEDNESELKHNSCHWCLTPNSCHVIQLNS